MPDFFEVLKTRRSIRAYQDKPVSDALLQELIDLAILAPSAMNIQPWAFSVITNRDSLRQLNTRVKEVLKASGFADNLEMENLRQALNNPDFDILYGAPALICIFGNAGMPVAAVDCQLAAENLFLAAHAKGLGTCYMGFVLVAREDPQVRQLLRIPEGFDLAAAACVGYPSMTPGPPERRPAQIEWVR
jgi:nitroreductase